ncbi:class I SAM-dependent methyltransferase [Mycolicibacterium sp. S3B2]|uniref:class I SAM-dependent methyltransferase n=1 Tax=Mycolicibacterium sp. S3B2 TaxID=3415120 RepID=UPI003C79AF1E
MADNYVTMVMTTGTGDIRTHPWHKAAIDAFADTVAPIGPVLDVGCGPGTVTAYLAAKGIEVSGIDLSPRMIDHARRLYPQCTFTVGSATDLDLRPASLGGILGWWSLFNLPRNILPAVLASFAAALRPGGQLNVATHVGNDDVERAEAYYGVPVQWTTYQWQPEQLIALVQQAGLRPMADLRLPADQTSGPTTILVAQRDNA